MSGFQILTVILSGITRKACKCGDIWQHQHLGSFAWSHQLCARAMDQLGSNQHTARHRWRWFYSKKLCKASMWKFLRISSFWRNLQNFAAVNSTLSTRSLAILSYQSDSTIFLEWNFLKLKRVVLPHPPLSWSKERAHTTYNCCALPLMRSFYFVLAVKVFLVTICSSQLF